MRPFPLRMAATLDAGAAGAVGVDEPKYHHTLAPRHTPTGS